ncbi:MAG: ABC transporter permease [Minisyncoccia bacterium]|jgi:ABC-2 type transport system permease protein
MSAIYILWLRQLKRYFRSKARMIGSIGQPILFLVALGFGFGPIFQKAGGGDYLQFLAPGVIAMGILFTAMFMGIEIIWDKQFGFLKETLVAPISRMTIMLGRTLGGATVALTQGVLVFLIAWAIGFRPSFELIGVAFIFMVLIAMLFTAIGTAIASVVDDMQGFPLIMNFLVMPLFFLSGALFPLAGLPNIIEIIARLDPLSYGIDGLRGALVPGSLTFGFWYDFSVLGVITLIVLAIGAYLFSKIEI